MGFFDDDPELTDFQKKQLINFVDEVNRLNIRTSNEDMFIKELMQYINELDIFFQDENAKVLSPIKLFKELSEEQQKEAITIINPILTLAKEYLQTIAPYDELMEHINKSNNLMDSYFEAKKDGGDIHISWSFLDKFKSKIGDQWFGLAHLVCYYENNYI